MASELKVTVPDIGDFRDVPVIEVLVGPGDAVDKDAAIAVLESDKATLDIPAPAAGVVASVQLKVGDKVSQGDAVLVLTLADATPQPAAATAAPPPAPAPAAAAATVAPVAPTPTPATAQAPTPTQGPAAAPLAVTIPDIGEFHDVPVIEVLVADGDVVEAEATLLVLESDKATLDVPAPRAGRVSGLTIKVGDKVSQGHAVCTITPVGAAAAVPAAAAAPAPVAPAPAAAAAPIPAASLPPAAGPGQVPYASPSIRKFARELGVDISAVVGTGLKGRITQDDVQAWVKRALSARPAAPAAGGGVSGGGAGISPIPVVDFAQFGAIETVPLARIRKLSAAHLHRCWLNVPHVTQTDEADITELEAFRKTISDEHAKTGGPKLTLLPFVMKAVAMALERYPEFRASLSPDGESLVMKRYTHLGFAADTPNGLVVPVVRDVDRKGISALAAETADLAKKARDGKLKADDMRGGVFSISSLGGIGGSHFTPIVNAPEVGILGVSKASMKPVWDGRAFQPRLMLPLSLSYDHRVIDGAYAARMIVLLGQLLGDLRRLAL